MRNKRLCRHPAAAAVLVSLSFATPQVCGDAAPTPAPLFADDSALEIDFEVDFRQICRDPESDDCEDLAGAISYTDHDGSRVRLDVTLRTRGRWSERTVPCQVPALFIYFDPAQTRGTLFDGQTVLPFTSHCQHGEGRYETYTLKEYIAHRIYNLITPASLQVRLVHAAYRNRKGKLRYRRYGFFVEHFEAAAARLGAELYEVDKLDAYLTDPTELAKFSVFQYMIGNLDWSVILQHNVILFRRTDGSVMAAPYDFDYSGIVNTEYSNPPRWSGLRSVRSRYYRGFCRIDIDWGALVNHYRERRSAIDGLVQNTPGLTKGGRKYVQDYIAKFWETLESEQRLNDRIVKACREVPDIATLSSPDSANAQ